MLITSFQSDFDQWGLLDEVSETEAYYGFPISDGADPLCAIMKVETSGTVTTRKWSNGSKSQNVLWSTRAAATYKFL